MAATAQDNGSRERLRSAQRRVESLKDQHAEARRDAATAKRDFEAADRPGKATDWPEFKEAQRAQARAAAIHDEIEEARGHVLQALAELGGGSAAPFELPERDRQTLADLASHAESKVRLGTVGIGTWSPREQLLDEIGGAAFMAADPGRVDVSDSARMGAHQGVVGRPRRALRLLDLFPSAPMTVGSSFEYLREVGNQDTAREQVEGAVKAQAEIEFIDAEAHAETIAHWTKIKRQSLADVPALDGVIRGRLQHGVMRRLENQLIAGQGHDVNELEGLLGVTGIGDVAYDADELAADQALEGIVDVLLSDAVPNFVALSPRDWAQMLKAKADGSGEYFSAGAFAVQAERLWNVPVVPTAAIPQGKALVGDAVIGATVFVREGVQVLVSDSDQDDFTRNRLTLLGEGRFGVAVWVPSAFALVHLAP
jgi:hypothetical protein